jgi:hypothetical protein
MGPPIGGGPYCAAAGVGMAAMAVAANKAASSGIMFGFIGASVPLSKECRYNRPVLPSARAD